MTDDALKIHEENNCGGDLVKVFSSVGIVWKGSGFYKTDARPKSSSKSSTSNDKKPAPETAKTDSSPAKTDQTPKATKPTSNS